MKAGDIIKVNKPGNLLHGENVKVLSLSEKPGRSVKVKFEVDKIEIEWFLTLEECGLESDPVKPNERLHIDAGTTTVKAEKQAKAIKIAKNKEEVQKRKSTKKIK